MEYLAWLGQGQARHHGLVNTALLAPLLTPWLDGSPTYAALATGLRSLALDGRLPVGERVPSERELAVVLHVSRATVTAAYDVLRSEGYLRSDRGAGSRISLPSAAPARPDVEPGRSSDLIDLSVAALPAPAALLDAVRTAAAALPSLLAGHGLHALGLPLLRERIAAHLSARGLSTRPDQILVTNGALHAWNLVLSGCARPGERVLVEQPTYPAVLDAVLARHLRPIALPVTSTGWSAFSFAGRTPSVAHVTPDGQNPTGLLATVTQRRRLLRELASTLVVVDETFADLVLDGDAPPSMASLGKGVLSVGSMSKSFWAGLRVGWVRGEPEMLIRLAQARASTDLATPVLEQLIAAVLLDEPQHVLAERRDLLRRGREALAVTMRRELPDWTFDLPAAGMVLWVRLPRPGATQLAAHALDLGLRISAGPRFTVDGTADRYVRLPFTMPVDQVAKIVSLLGEAWGRRRSGAVATRTPGRWTA